MPSGFSNTSEKQLFMSGAGIKKGYSHGGTDEIGYYVIKGKRHIHDLQANNYIYHGL